MVGNLLTRINSYDQAARIPASAKTNTIHFDADKINYKRHYIFMFKFSRHRKLTCPRNHRAMRVSDSLADILDIKFGMRSGSRLRYHRKYWKLREMIQLHIHV